MVKHFFLAQVAQEAQMVEQSNKVVEQDLCMVESHSNLVELLQIHHPCIYFYNFSNETFS